MLEQSARKLLQITGSAPVIAQRFSKALTHLGRQRRRQGASQADLGNCLDVMIEARVRLVIEGIESHHLPPKPE